MISSSRSSAPTNRPVDQAQGLRQMFATRVLRFVPVVANSAAAPYGGVVLERLCTAYGAMGLHTLVVDASEQARAPGELAQFDLSEGVEQLSPDVSYLAARGLPLKYADTRGSCSAFMDAVADAAPQCDVVLVHASASELVRVFGDRAKAHNLRPLVFSDDRPEGLTSAYAGVKLMSQRARWMAYDLLVCALPQSDRADAIAQRLAQCADSFLGVAQRQCVRINPHEPSSLDPGARFIELAAGLLQCALPHTLGDSAFDHLVSPGAALPSRMAPVLN
ncbi:flagellar biosynthesis protein [Aquabacterium sp.]|uniref:flagellar biosynthesis protein n=1 Tax=Aquabacterium sp. TaxID=1872578 RepID=UPI0035B4B8E4